ncbi:MAG: ABC transporter permease [Verrucomicrobia bacterium]|nr:ABC transporter permease [Verrucomicrobiota bacterium]MCH8526404.1 ABC transporter permease [Kiritimatiellia bacterium]
MKSLYYSEIIFYKAWAELKSECGRTLGGALWWFADPLLSIFIYYLAFGLILQRAGEGYVAYLCVGIVFWRWFQGSVSRAASSILREKPLMAKVYMPKVLFPVICMLADFFKFLIMLLVLFVFLWVSGNSPGITYWAVPVLLVMQFMFIASVSGFFAALVPFMPDLLNMLNHGLHLMFFLSGVFFSVHEIGSPQLRGFLLLNPMAGLITSYRLVLLENQWPDWTYLFYLFLANTAGVLAVTGLLIRFDRVYPKIIL